MPRTNKYINNDKKSNPARCHGEKGQVHFRVLCATTAAGGLIGHSGTIVKRLERETSVKIKVDLVVNPTCEDRLVHVTGSSSVDRNLHVDGDNNGLPVSAAQEGLVRVLERMLEVDSPKDGIARCRLLVENGLVGGVMGKEGKRINKICKDTCAYVKVLPAESLPCADPGDELILITGCSLAVKKALVVVSQYLQKSISKLVGGVHGATSSGVLRSSIKMETGHAHLNDTVNEGVAAEVVFKLLCPYHAAGAVIGTRGRKVKALEEKTGASICFSAQDANSYERVITVSAFENREVQYSSAQNAIVRIFNEIVSSEERDTITTRLLISSNQSDWLNVGGVSGISAIQKATGATLKILEDEYAPIGGSTDEKVIQIDGDCPSVQIALFQVSWSLRECFFNAILAEDNSPLLPHKLFNVPSEGSGPTALTDNMNKCRVSEEVDGSLKSKLPLPYFSNGHCLTASSGSSRDIRTTKGGSDYGSGNKVTVTNTKLEIAVREDVFGAVYGEGGSNLARLRLISGATVEVLDPRPGSKGKVIISGTRDQTLVAQSLLQAFVMAAE